MPKEEMLGPDPFVFHISEVNGQEMAHEYLVELLKFPAEKVTADLKLVLLAEIEYWHQRPPSRTGSSRINPGCPPRMTFDAARRKAP